jgi:voltage-gated potassium channel
VAGFNRSDVPGSVELPRHDVGPVSQVLRRMALAFATLALAWLAVWLGRSGYHDNSLDRAPDLTGTLYYVTVSLSTTGYGDIVPVSESARLVNIFVLTPLRVIFLIILVGTTVEVLVGRTREQLRRNRWRQRMGSRHTVVIGYGTQGRAAVSTLRALGTPLEQIVVVEMRGEGVAEATHDGLAAVHGDGSRIAVLRRALIESADAVLVATGQDDSAMLVTLSARRLNPRATIATSIREAEHVELARQSGATSVVASAEAAGRLLGAATFSTSVNEVLGDLMRHGGGLDMQERPVSPEEVGRAPAECGDIVLAVLRGGRLVRFSEVERLAAGDRLVTIVDAGAAPQPAG